MDTSGFHIFFWKTTGSYGELSQWHRSLFVHDGRAFATSEQLMMYGKADIFGDTETAGMILSNIDWHLAEHRRMGRMVKVFNPAVWHSECVRMVVVANLCKFTQNDRLREILMSTGERILVESSPTDRVWSIGFSDGTP